MNTGLLGFVRLTRPANLPTAAADVLAGIAIAIFYKSGGANMTTIQHFPDNMFLLVFSSIFLYAGGVVLNDVFDYEIDVVERPERPIPQKLVSLRSALIFGVSLLCIGVVLAFMTTCLCGLIATFLTGFIVTYNRFFKSHAVLGPINMGICRGLNLLLGICILGSIAYWWSVIVPVIYIFAITMISRGEVHGKNKKHIILAGFLYILVIFAVMGMAYFYTENVMVTLPFLCLFAILVFKPLIRAYRKNAPDNIKKAVVAGVLSLIVLDAAMATGFSSWWYGLGILSLLPISIVLSKLFAVT